MKVDSASQTITVKPAPSPIVTKVGTTLSVPSVYGSYQWYTVAFPPLPISGATNASFTYTVAGSYAVVVDSGGCKGIGLYVPVGIHDITGADNIFWLTQLDNSTLMLRMAVPMNEAMNVEIFDATGRSVHTEGWDRGVAMKQISGISVPAGIYIIKLSNSNTSTILKWLKH